MKKVMERSVRAVVSPIAVTVCAVTLVLSSFALAAPSAHAVDDPGASPQNTATPTAALQVSATEDVQKAEIRGSGAVPSTTVTITIAASDGTESASRPITADASGSFQYTASGLKGGTYTVTASNEGRQASTTVSVPAARPKPTIDQVARVTGGVVSGTASSQGTVTARASGTAASCSATVSNGRWSCVLRGDRLNGRYDVSAEQDGQVSDAVSLQFDNVAPGAPEFTSPADGASIESGTTLQVTGTGEDGAQVRVSNGTTPVCTARVSGGAWSCTLGNIPDGAFTLSAMQFDYVGNASDTSTVTFQMGPLTKPTPSRGARPSPHVTPTPTPTPTHRGDVIVPPGAPAPTDPPQSSPPLSLGHLLTNPAWKLPTPYSTSLASITTMASPATVVPAIVMSIGFLVLVMIPTALLAAVLPRFRRGRLVGRNNASRADASPFTKPLNKWITATLLVVATAGIITMSMPVSGSPNYLRMFAAAGIATALVNAVGTITLVHGARRILQRRVYVRMLPSLLLLTAAGALVSRVANIVPPLIFAQMLGFHYDRERPRNRAIASFVQAGVLTVLGLGAWVAYSMLPAVDAFWVQFFRECAATTTIASLTSAVISVVPIGVMYAKNLASNTGHRVSWHLIGAWIAASLIVTYLACSAVLSTGCNDVFRTIFGCAAALFAATCLGIWAYYRFVVPERHDA